MKKIIVITFLFLLNLIFAQESKQIVINWNTSTQINYQTFGINCPQFQIENFNFDFNTYTPVFSIKFPASNTVSTTNFSIKNIVSQVISSSELGEIKTENIKNSLSVSIQNFKDRENGYYGISFVPIINENGVFKKIISFTIDIPFASENRVKSTQTIQNSVLSSGDFYRFSIVNSGVYKLSKQFLRDLGFNVNVDPRKIKIYGNGGKMIPHQNNNSYPIDLTENAIRFIGEEDGNFNDNDFIIFYAEGIDNWVEESKTNLNLYSDKAFYYVYYDGNNGKRIIENVQPTGSPNISFTTFLDTKFVEEDAVNISKMGRKWFSKSFNLQNKKTYKFNFPNLVSGSNIQVEAQAAATSSVVTSFKCKANGTDIGTISLPASTELHSESNLFTSIIAAENVDLEVEYVNGGIPSSNGYLNFINLKAQRNLTGYGKQFRFENPGTLNNVGIGEFTINQAQGINQVWDITDIYNVSAISNNNSSTINFKTNIGVLKKYVAVDFNDLYIPERVTNTRIGNQNLKGTIFLNQNNVFEDIDYLIITPNFLLAEANRLANFHRTNYQYRTKVVTLESIYPEFSSGQQDIGAIRNFIKYVYENASNNANRLKFVNLFGDASFDPKNRTQNNTNIVPSYQSLISNSLAGSFIADDFFGCMDNSEGEMDNGSFVIDVAIGRMIVSNTNQARQMVDKIINYHDFKSYGRWRNNVVFVSDDADKSSDASLQVELDQTAVELYNQRTFININKIYLDSYNQVSSSGGQRYPNARKDLFEAFERGALIVNYLGHGNENGITGERIFENTDAQAVNNPFKYTCFITLTCEFSRFDNPLRPTAGEFTYWNPIGGAVAMITTTRQIGQLTAENVNPVLNNKLFAYNSTVYPTIGEALRLTKNQNNASSLKVISLIGDPAMKLAIPSPKIVLTKINEVDVALSNTVFNALSSIKINGEVRDVNGTTLLNDYNGEVAIQIYDKDLQRFGLNNDGNSPNFQFSTLGNVIFRGNASVINGKFELTFIVPKDIKIPVGNGRISFYAKSNNPTLKNQTGYSNDILVGGINENAPADNIPPRVRLYMNDTNFVNGGITNESPIFLAFLEDENGINTASGIGHDIVAILDGDETKPFILNDFYETELNDYTKGKVAYQFRNLAVGLHTIKFRAWDVYNNPITAEIQFVVMGNEIVTLTNVLNYPNPFVNYTQFWFSHNRPFEPLEVQVQILTITGKLVKTINQTVVTDGFLSKEISWDGRDDFGDRIGKGVYIYKLTVKSNITNSKTEKIEKLVIL
jgi:Peptidase family C25